ncbi:MAG TPA: peptidyl-prolyl cis-trans isomerase [Terriglobales bacterium]|jgi:peptidyl-prolyl cis-trans isomerase C|nr:peptidyl-prolyl cis-trans isomerase [Terriglobales bacterium]
MKSKLLISVLVLTALAPVSAQLVASHASTQPSQTPPATQPTGKPVARVNGTVLTDLDLLREEYTIFPYARQHNGRIPKQMEGQIRDGAMQMIIFEELVYQEAVRRKMTIPAATLQKAETDFRGQFRSSDEYERLLQTEFHGSRQALRDKIRRSLLIDALLKQEVGNKSVVSPAELRDYYNANPARFQYPESFAIQTISFVPPQKATAQQLEEARKRAEAALPHAKAAKNYEEFGMLAEKISEDDYRVMMGDHKAVERAKLAPQVVQALLALQPGQVTDIIQVEQIYTIIRLNKHIPAGKTKLDDVKDQLKKELEQKKTNQLRAALGKKLRQNASIEIL